MATLHENYRRTETEVIAPERSFALLFAVVFLLLAVRTLRHHGAPVVGGLFAGTAVAFAVIGLAVPTVLRPLNRLWYRFGLLLYRVVNPIVMAVLYFLAVVPTGLLMRLLGKDPLKLRLDPAAPTYWVPRGHAPPRAETMKRQF